MSSNTDDRLVRMFEDQLYVQSIIQPDVRGLLDMTVEERLEAIRYNYIALVQELSEAMDECGWKSWATSKHINEDKMFGELRDVWQFLINLMFLATGDSPQVLAARLTRELMSKHEINITRAKSQYDGVSTKCPGCRRALDEVTLSEIYTVNGELEKVLCGVCDAVLDIEQVRQLLTD